jgi:hypothetical protein
MLRCWKILNLGWNQSSPGKVETRLQSKSMFDHFNGYKFNNYNHFILLAFSFLLKTAIFSMALLFLMVGSLTTNSRSSTLLDISSSSKGRSSQSSPNMHLNSYLYTNFPLDLIISSFSSNLYFYFITPIVFLFSDLLIFLRKWLVLVGWSNLMNSWNIVHCSGSVKIFFPIL